MTYFSRGRGVHRLNSNAQLKPGIKVAAPNPLCQRLYDEILKANLTEIRSILEQLQSEDENMCDNVTKFILKCAFEDEKFNISFLKTFPQFFKMHENLKIPGQYRKLHYTLLQSKYEDIDNIKENHYLLRNLSCMLVSSFLTRSSPIYKFLVAPIIKSFKFLLDSEESENIDFLAVLLLQCYTYCEKYELDSYSEFQVEMRKKILELSNTSQRYTLLFIIDVTSGVMTTLSSSLHTFYRENLNEITIYKLCNWVDNSLVKYVLQYETKKKDEVTTLSNLNLKDTTQNSPTSVSKQPAPRAILGTGATEK